MRTSELIRQENQNKQEEAVYSIPPSENENPANNYQANIKHEQAQKRVVQNQETGAEN